MDRYSYMLQIILLLAPVLVSACEDSSSWVDEFGDGCDWFVANDPGCTQFSDYGQQANCPVECGRCQCDEELSGYQDSGYRGCQKTTRSGHTCQNWASQSPHTHMALPASNPELVQNFCRNPTNGDTIWCYTVTSVRWEYCDPLPVPPLSPPSPSLPPSPPPLPLSPPPLCNGSDSGCANIQEGDGDCDSDNDCATGLRCGTNNCQGSQFDTTDDCCSIPSPEPPQSPPRPSFPHMPYAGVAYSFSPTLCSPPDERCTDLASCNAIASASYSGGMSNISFTGDSEWRQASYPGGCFVNLDSSGTYYSIIWNPNILSDEMPSWGNYQFVCGCHQPPAPLAPPAPPSVPHAPPALPPPPSGVSIDMTYGANVGNCGVADQAFAQVTNALLNMDADGQLSVATCQLDAVKEGDYLRNRYVQPTQGNDRWPTGYHCADRWSGGLCPGPYVCDGALIMSASCGHFGKGRWMLGARS